jgi:hypothetical protein
MMYLSAPFLLLSLLVVARGDHCSTPFADGSTPLPVPSPGDGEAILVTDVVPAGPDLSTDYSFLARAGCTYTLTFCSNGGSSNATEVNSCNYPYATFWFASGTSAPTPCPVATGCIGGGIDAYTATDTETIIVAVTTWEDCAASYTLAIVGSGSSCSAPTGKKGGSSGGKKESSFPPGGRRKLLIAPTGPAKQNERSSV